MKIYNRDEILILDIEVDDNSYRYREIMGEHSLTLYFSLPEYVDIPVGSYCVYQGLEYTLESPLNLKMNHSRDFEYTVVMESPQSHLTRYKLRNTVDRRLKFSMTAKPHEHLQMLVDNLNERESGWTVGECIEGTEKLISYNHTFCSDALSQIAETFNTEYEIVGREISLRKVEYNKDNPLPLSYGRGNGFRPGIGRTNASDEDAIEILYAQGGSTNIDASKYGAQELHLPKGRSLRYDGVHFEDEEGFDVTKSRTYMVSSDGYYVRRQDTGLLTRKEDSLDCSEIYPSRDETVLKVIEVDAGNNLYDVVIDAPASLDYGKYGIGGESPTIVFQTGELAGRTFDLETDSGGNIDTERYNGTVTGWRLKIVPQETDGITMPGGSFVPAEGDVLRVFGIQLPEMYIRDHATMSGAEWDMFRECVRYLYDHEDRRFTFTGELDGIWAKKNWLDVGGRIRLGGFVSFTDTRFQPDPVLIRITGIKDYINNPYSPEIELSNETAKGGVTSELRKIGSDEVLNEERHSQAINFTKRRFRDAKETMSMLQDAMLNFGEGISPITVQTMMMLVGDESLQFRFVSNSSNPQQVTHVEEYDPEQKVLHLDAGIIQHMTLGISSMSSSHDVTEYRFWTVPAYDSPALADQAKRYYVYAMVLKDGQTGEFLLSETARPFELGQYYFLLVGILNSEVNGDRSYVSLYGFTEILPGRITTDMIVSADGKTYFDLVNSQIAGRINFLDGLISGLVGAVDDDDPTKILAGLNGSDTGKDAEHGKIVFFGGNDGGKESIGNARTKIFADGELYSRTAKIAGNADLATGKLGKMYFSENTGIIGGGKIKDETEDIVGQCEMQLFNGFLNAFRQDDDGSEYQVSIAMVPDNFIAHSIYDIDNNLVYSSMLRRINYGFVVRRVYNKSGTKDDFAAAMTIKMSGNGAKSLEAIRCEKGVFAGLRPKTKHVSESSYGIQTTDFFICCWSQSTQSLALPVDPENGQTYIIMKGSSNTIYLNGNGRAILSIPGQREEIQSTFASTSQQSYLVVFNEEDDKWWLDSLR